MSESSPAGQPSLRIGIVNLMPRAETYERLIVDALGASGRRFEPVWLRLSTPAYASSDRERIASVYLPLAAALAEARLDGLIVSGAPVEDIAFEAVTYWQELSGLLRQARVRVRSTLGLCWGALALAQLVGIEKIAFTRKLAGVFPLERYAPEHPLLRASSPQFLCPQSRHSGLAPRSLQAAISDGRVRLLAGSEAAGAVILESGDGRFVMHVGHPEYDAPRLGFEYRRDAADGCSDLAPPHDYDLDNPIATWRAASSAFFGAWLDSLR
jgi:homoserine O-succinyltransferase